MIEQNSTPNSAENINDADNAKKPSRSKIEVKPENAFKRFWNHRATQKTVTVIANVGIVALGAVAGMYAKDYADKTFSGPKMNAKKK